MTGGESQQTKGQPGITQAALFGLCPRCGAKGLWAGPARFDESCGTCGQELAAHEPSGRLLYLAVLPVTVLLILAALKLDDALRPPLWLHALLWPPVVALAVIGALRFAKTAALIARIRKETP